MLSLLAEPEIRYDLSHQWVLTLDSEQADAPLIPILTRHSETGWDVDDRSTAFAIPVILKAKRRAAETIEAFINAPRLLADDARQAAKAVGSRKWRDAKTERRRVRRLRSGVAMSSAPSARTARTVSRFVAVADDAAGLTVRGVQHIVEYKFERTRILAGEVLYRLVRTDAGIALARKEIRLVNSDDPLWGIGYLL